MTNSDEVCDRQRADLAERRENELAEQKRLVARLRLELDERTREVNARRAAMPGWTYHPKTGALAMNPGDDV